MQLKEALIGKLTEKEMSQLKTAFDVVGSIAVMEIDDALKKKEKIIANALLSLNKNIKTVLKKADEHSGEFRTQKMKYLAGEKTKETVHKENNTILKLDVEKVYFSPRLSTERKRIAQEVKNGENILVMFSGCAPYPCVIAKNTKAKRVVGIEINPVGHKYGEENVKLNKLKNVELFNGDVKKIIPLITEKKIIGLKSNWRAEHLKARENEKTELMELYIGTGDLENHYDEICNACKELKKKGMKVILHMPEEYNGTEINICAADKKIRDSALTCFSVLEKMCKELKLMGFIAHPYSYYENEAGKINNGEYEKEKKRVVSFLKNNRYSYMMIENMSRGPFAEPKEMEVLINKYKPKFCLDVAHLHLTSKNEEEFYESIKKLSLKAAYFHIADTKYVDAKNVFGKEHTCPIGQGKINFLRVLPYVKIGISEVVSESELSPVEMLDSYKKINAMTELLRHFDRIVMPLPKSAEDFLPTALSAAKKGAVIHFYDFLHEDEFDKAEEKAKKACEKAGVKYKKLNFTKCGQHSPRTYRVCLDFKVE